MATIYIYLGEKELGPYTASELHGQLDSGALAPNTPARLPDSSHWHALNELLASMPQPVDSLAFTKSASKDAFEYIPPPVPVVEGSSYVPPPVSVGSPNDYVPPPLTARPASIPEKSASASRSLPKSVFQLPSAAVIIAAVGIAAVAAVITLFVFRSSSSPGSAAISSATISSATISSATIQPSPPVAAEGAPQVETQNYLAKALPDFIRLAHVSLEPAGQDSFNFTADLIAKEDLFQPDLLHTGLDLPDPTWNLPPRPQDLLILKRTTQANQHVTAQGTVRATPSGQAWQLNSVVFTTKLADFGGPRRILPPDFVVPGTPEGDAAVSNWNALVTSYRQMENAVRAQKQAAASPVATPATDAAPGLAPPQDSTPPVPQTALAPSPTTTEQTNAPITAATEQPTAHAPEAELATHPPAEPRYPNFDGDEVIQRCRNGSGYLPQVFASEYEGHTLVWSGTVARYNTSQGLIIFKGGGIYPSNWDLQISSTDHAEFPLNRRVHFRFRLNKMLVMPFVGISFRGDHLHKL